jgi:hypothetical protein
MVGRENDLSTRVLFNAFKSYVYSQSDPEGFWIFSKNQEDINSERVDIEKVSRYLPEMGVISGQNIKISGNFLDIKLRRGIIQKVSVHSIVVLLARSISAAVTFWWLV